MPQLTDEELIASAQRDPAQANACWEQLFLRHQQKVALWCLRYTGDRDRAADLTQEIFLKLRQNLSSFQGNSKFTTWLYTVCRNHCINEIRSAPNRKEQPLPEIDAPYLEAPLPDYGESLDRTARVDQARLWIEQLLDPVEKQVFHLHYVEEVSLDSVTHLLQLSNASGAKAYIVSAKRKLSEAVRRWKVKNER
ncbi:MAG: RNA polymerase sigma factor [Bryobacterales bacterium]|nr:RNA polymerase sigma factor [Bryobacterales bacterium]